MWSCCGTVVAVSFRGLVPVLHVGLGVSVKEGRLKRKFDMYMCMHRAGVLRVSSCCTCPRRGLGFLAL